MKHFRIYNPEEKIRESLQHKIDNLTKPKGSLGRLEELALQAGLIQQTLSPALRQPHHIVFAADHGITEENVSVSPKEVTWQQCLHFVKGSGSGINFLCRQHGFTLCVVDAGVDCDFPPGSGITDMKVRRGTRNYVYEAAMTPGEMDLCIERGATIVRKVNETGCNVVSFGEMGIGNTSSSSLWMTCLTGIPLLQCVGAGAGLDCDGIRHKYQVLKRALDNYRGDRSVTDVMRYFGGYEMVMAVGAMLQAAEREMIILVDGFIMTACMLAASRLYPEVMPYAVFGHRSDETGHGLLLEALGARPLLSLGMRLGEGTGAVCAYPVLDSAVRMMNEMNSFEGGKVTKYF
ncbi:MAG: nicotinate-nucleotide--dimethylbenzimidazole phosphoribosyltransferase [Tannerella sp.]|jgi:nicotinate-nucleotide--dimethylbenzimidazole phosphoribosyltransferase|nr:nicotinate-nucleotide--dimethylbenzimidazole phosphoribosyltransferase [Tannerella sp.]